MRRDKSITPGVNWRGEFGVNPQGGLDGRVMEGRADMCAGLQGRRGARLLRFARNDGLEGVVPVVEVEVGQEQAQLRAAVHVEFAQDGAHVCFSSC